MFGPAVNSCTELQSNPIWRSGDPPRLNCTRLWSALDWLTNCWTILSPSKPHTTTSTSVHRGGKFWLHVEVAATLVHHSLQVDVAHMNINTRSSLNEKQQKSLITIYALPTLANWIATVVASFVIFATSSFWSQHIAHVIYSATLLHTLFTLYGIFCQHHFDWKIRTIPVLLSVGGTSSRDIVSRDDKSGG